MTLKPVLRSLKVIIGTDTNRSDTYDFLLTFHCTHGTISHQFRDKCWFQSKIEKKIPTLCTLRPRWRGSPWNFVSAHGIKKKTRMMGLPDRERSLTISSAVWMWQTDGHRTIKDRAYA